MSCLLIAILLFLPQPQRLPVDELVNRVSETYGKLQDFSADFDQLQQDSLNQPARQVGHVDLKSRRRARFAYKWPREFFEYFDGKTYTRYTPQIKQAIQKPMGKADEEYLAILQIVGNRGSPWKDQFDQKIDTNEGPLMQQGNRVVRLIPKNKNLKDLLIEIDPANFMIHRFVFTYATGERNEFRFRDIKTTSLDPALFIFKAPPQVVVIKE